MRILQNLAVAVVASMFTLPAQAQNTPPPVPQNAIPGGLVITPTNPTTCDLLILTYTATGNIITATDTQVYANVSFNGFVTSTRVPMGKIATNPATWASTSAIPATAANAQIRMEGMTNNFDTNRGEDFNIAISACESNPVPVTFGPSVGTSVITPCSDVTATYNTSGTIFSASTAMVFFIVFDTDPNVTQFKVMTEQTTGVYTTTFDIPSGPANAIVFFSDGDTNFDDNLGSLYTFAISVCPDTSTNAPNTNVFFFSVRNDLDGDGLGDLLLRDEDSSTYSILLMDGLASIEQLDLLGTPTDISPFRFVASSDLDGDGIEDLIFREGSSGKHVVGYMAGGEMIGSEYITFGGATNVAPWHVVAGGDFDGDGFGDLLYQEGDSGVYAIAYLDGSEALASEYLFGGEPVDVSPWRAVAGGDLDGDGLTDLVFKFGEDGTYAVAFMEGATVLNSAFFMGAETDVSPWRLVATSDLDGDGFSELIFRFGNEDLYDAAFMDAENVLFSDYLFEEAGILPDEIVGGR